MYREELSKLMSATEVKAASGNLGRVTAIDASLGSRIQFVYDTEQGIQMRIGDHTIPVEATLIRDVTRYIGLPKPYVAKTPGNLIVPHLNYWYHEVMADVPARVLLHDDKAYSMAINPKVDFISVPDVIDTLVETVGEGNIAGFHKPMFQFDATLLNLVLTDTFDVIKGDMLNVGIRFEHSLNDLNPDHAYAYVFRQICSNGMITMDKIKSWSRRRGEGGGEGINGSHESYRKWVDSVVVESRSAVDEEKKRLTGLTNIKTDQSTAEIIDHVLTRDWVAKDVREEIMALAIDEPSDTLYDVYNIFTKVATHSDVFDKHPAALPLIENAAKGLSFHSQLCPVCHHQVKK